jgi:prepilin-type N-terminal cleavage/methylation domain-containing protein
MQDGGCRRRRPSSFCIHTSSLASSAAFTLLELLTVIAIIGIMAAIALPTLRGLKPNTAGSATRQLLDAVSHARQLALGMRTTVYMVFVPPSFFNDNTYKASYGSWSAADQALAKSLLDKQMVGYNYVTLRSIGDQPGVSYPQYLDRWRTLPAGAYVSLEKFSNSTVPVLKIQTNGVTAYNVYAFNWTNNIPFPSERTPPHTSAQPYTWLPYIAFDGTGQLVYGNGQGETQPEFIPITQGTVAIPRDRDTKEALAQPVSVIESPVGNTTSNFTLVFVDQLTGRARIESRKVQ